MKLVHETIFRSSLAEGNEKAFIGKEWKID